MVLRAFDPIIEGARTKHEVGLPRYPQGRIPGPMIQ